MKVTLTEGIQGIDRDATSFGLGSEAQFACRRQNSCFYCGASIETTVESLIDTRFGTPGSYEIRRCRNCGLERTWPEPSLDDLRRLYESQYNFGGESGTLYTNVRERFLRSFLFRLWVTVDGDISFHLRRGSGRLLDIGCNEGRSLQIYKSNGFSVEGLEINPRAAECARKAGFEVHTCLLDEFLPKADYDIAVLSNVLEHALDPVQMLRDVHRILSPGGEVWISCPNSESWMRTTFGLAWINWHVPFHITHFCSSTLRQLLEANGYTEIGMRQISPALWVAQSTIAYFFATEGRKNRQLRNPLLIFVLMILARFVLFPALWLGNKFSRGDCLLVTARKK